MTEKSSAATRRYVCPKAPPNWSAEWMPPMLGAVPCFCPWCDKRIEEHKSYLLTITTGTSIGVPDAAAA